VLSDGRGPVNEAEVGQGEEEHRHAGGKHHRPSALLGPRRCVLRRLVVQLVVAPHRHRSAAPERRKERVAVIVLVVAAIVVTVELVHRGEDEPVEDEDGPLENHLEEVAVVDDAAGLALRVLEQHRVEATLHVEVQREVRDQEHPSEEQQSRSHRGRRRGG
jgi:hypothetical protein